jgi:hypothetical protein
MSSTNSPQLGEVGRLFRDPITDAQDHVRKQALPHGHHRTSVATAPTTELLVINLVSQQDPEPDPQLSCGRYFRFPQTLLHHLVLVKTLQLHILANRMPHRFTPQKTKKRIPLFTQSPQSLPASAGVFARDQSHIAGYRFSDDLNRRVEELAWQRSQARRLIGALRTATVS